MLDVVLTVAVGFVSGLLSGQFGIGGALVSTPAIRLVLGYPALVAVGTPLPVVIPTALAGSVSYTRAGLADVKAGFIIGTAGMAAAVGGAALTPLVGGSIILLVTAAILVYMAIDLIVATLRDRDVAPGHVAVEASEGVEADFSAAVEEENAEAIAPRRRVKSRLLPLVAVGLIAGGYSGFLGLGGGSVIVPLLVRWLRYPAKNAIGTSLIAISIMAIPGSIAHWILGNVDLELALLLVTGVVPGALLGARVTQAARERSVRIGFAAVLLAAAAMLVFSEGRSL